MAGAGVFVRPASGLLRELSQFKILVWTIANVNLLMTTFLFIWEPLAFPGTNIALSVGLVLIGVIIHNLFYSFMTSTIPRAGGAEYLSGSRAWSVYGYTLSWMWMWCILFVVGWYAWAFSTMCAAGFFGYLGVAFNMPSLVMFAGWAATPIGAFILAAIMVCISAGLQILGTRVFYAIASPMVIIALIGSVGLILAILNIGHDGFVTAYNSFMLNFQGMWPEGATAPYYDWVVNTANGFGVGRGPFDWSQTILSMGVPFMCLAFACTASVMAGEVRRGGEIRIQSTAMVGTTIMMGIFVMLIAWSAVRTMGFDFLAAMGLANFAGVPIAGIPFPPYLQLLASIGQHAAVAIMIAVTFIFWFYLQVQIVSSMAPRIIFAWSFDRVLPEWISRVGKRRTPSNAIIASTIIILIALALYCFTPYMGYVNVIFYAAVMFMMFAVVGMIFPWKCKSVYEASAMRKYQIGGFPLITLIAVLDFIFMFIIVYAYLSVDGLNANAPISLIALTILTIIGPFIYIMSRAIRARQGIDLELTYKEVPPA